MIAKPRRSEGVYFTDADEGDIDDRVNIVLDDPGRILKEAGRGMGSASYCDSGGWNE